MNSRASHGVPHRGDAQRRPQRRVKPAQTARPMEAKRTAGIRTPAALREIDASHMAHAVRDGEQALRRNAAAAGFARDNGGMGLSPSFLLQAYYAREPRAAAKGNASGPWGPSTQGGQ